MSVTLNNITGFVVLQSLLGLLFPAEGQLSITAETSSVVSCGCPWRGWRLMHNTVSAPLVKPGRSYKEKVVTGVASPVFVLQPQSAAAVSFRKANQSSTCCSIMNHGLCCSKLHLSWMGECI